MTAIGPHAPVGGRLVYDEPPAFPHIEREHEPCPRCGGRKSARSRVCRACNNYAIQHAKRLRRQFEAWLARRAEMAERKRA